MKKQTQIRQEIDEVINRIDDLLLAEKFEDVNAVLSLLIEGLDSLSDPLIVTYLGITLGAKEKLSARKVFYDRAIEVVAVRRGQKGAETLLKKYC